MKKLLFILAVSLSCGNAIASLSPDEQFLKDVYAISMKQCQNQTDFDYMAASAALSDGFRGQAIIIAKRIIKSVGGDASGGEAENMTDNRIKFFSGNIPLAKVIVTPGVTGERFNACMDQRMSDARNAIKSSK